MVDHSDVGDEHVSAKEADPQTKTIFVEGRAWNSLKAVVPFDFTP
jgi:hypothetical protein